MSKHEVRELALPTLVNFSFTQFPGGKRPMECMRLGNGMIIVLWRSSEGTNSILVLNNGNWVKDSGWECADLDFSALRVGKDSVIFLEEKRSVWYPLQRTAVKYTPGTPFDRALRCVLGSEDFLLGARPGQEEIVVGSFGRHYGKTAFRVYSVRGTQRDQAHLLREVILPHGFGLDSSGSYAILDSSGDVLIGNGNITYYVPGAEICSADAEVFEALWFIFRDGSHACSDAGLLACAYYYNKGVIKCTLVDTGTNGRTWSSKHGSPGAESMGFVSWQSVGVCRGKRGPLALYFLPPISEGSGEGILLRYGDTIGSLQESDRNNILPNGFTIDRPIAITPEYLYCLGDMGGKYGLICLALAFEESP